MPEPAITGGYVIIWGLVTLFVLLDADERGANKLIWGPVVLLFSVVGLLAYLAVVTGPDSEDVSFK